MNKIQEVTNIALAMLDLYTRSNYARNVLLGRQNWSGSDLRGKAKHWGSRYRELRRKAGRALQQAGGLIVATENNRLRTAAPAGQDDFGNMIVNTRSGAAVLNKSGKQFRHLQ